MNENIILEFEEIVRYVATETKGLTNDINRVKELLNKLGKDENKLLYKLLNKTNCFTKLLNSIDKLLDKYCKMIRELNYSSECIDEALKLKDGLMSSFKANLLYNVNQTQPNTSSISDGIKIFLEDVKECVDYVSCEVDDCIKEYNPNLESINQLKRDLNSKTPVFIDKNILSKCFNMDYISDKERNSLEKIIDDNNTKYKEFQKNIAKKLSEEYIEEHIVESKDMLVIDNNLSNNQNIQSSLTEKINEIEKNLNLMKSDDVSLFFYIKSLKKKYPNKIIERLKAIAEEKKNNDKSWNKIFEMLMDSQVKEDIENNKINLIFAEQFFTDIKSIRSDKYLNEIKKAINMLENSNEKSNCDIKKLTDIELFELRFNRVRLLFNYLPDNSIYVFGCLIKDNRKENNIFKMFYRSSDQYYSLRKEKHK